MRQRQPSEMPRRYFARQRIPRGRPKVEPKIAAEAAARQLLFFWGNNRMTLDLAEAVIWPTAELLKRLATEPDAVRARLEGLWRWYAREDQTSDAFKLASLGEIEAAILGTPGGRWSWDERLIQEVAE